jgi:hypothetical protein
MTPPFALIVAVGLIPVSLCAADAGSKEARRFACSLYYISQNEREGIPGKNPITIASRDQIGAKLKRGATEKIEYQEEDDHLKVRFSASVGPRCSIDSNPDCKLAPNKAAAASGYKLAVVEKHAQQEISISDLVQGSDDFRTQYPILSFSPPKGTQSPAGKPLLSVSVECGEVYY